MDTHVRVLGILHIVFGSLGALIAVGVLMFFGAIAGAVGMSANLQDNLPAIPILGGIGGIAFLVIMAFSLPGLITGIGLLYLRPWARILGIVISALDLLQIPFGTALGIYGLWTLLSPQTEALFRRGAQPNLYVHRTSGF
ncbi:MAG TPA: hypothetical protein VN610_06205 [Bryobacteraceae bacterium]|nr:hypothetical protein [Bryobacteraceae bacterium]